MSYFRKIMAIIMVVSSFMFVAACLNSDSSSSNSTNIVDTAIAAGQFTTLAAALDATGLTQTLRTSGSFTVFAPTDAAFAKLPAGTLDSLLADPAALRNILLYDVVSGAVPSSALSNGQVVSFVWHDTNMDHASSFY